MNNYYEFQNKAYETKKNDQHKHTYAYIHTCLHKSLCHVDNDLIDQVCCTHPPNEVKVFI